MLQDVARPSCFIHVRPGIYNASSFGSATGQGTKGVSLRRSVISLRKHFPASPHESASQGPSEESGAMIGHNRLNAPKHGGQRVRANAAAPSILLKSPARNARSPAEFERFATHSLRQLCKSSRRHGFSLHMDSLRTVVQLQTLPVGNGACAGHCDLFVLLVAFPSLHPVDMTCD